MLVAPQYSPDDFLAFNEFVQDAEAYLRRAELDDTFQLVAFHPQFCFAGENPDDASNYVNRAPHPAIHLLLQDDVTAAVDSHPNSLEVPQINKKELRKLGVAQMRRLVSDARRDAGDPTMMAGSEPVRCVIIGGTGRIGTAVASHLLSISDGNVQVVLAGRDEGKGGAALDEILSEATKGSVEFVMCDFRDSNDLKALLDGAAAVVHTAGPYAGEEPLVLKAAIDCKVPVYVDLSDPIDYLDAAKAIGQAAAGTSETIALCAAGAFPGLSNVLAMECADQLNEPVRDVDFSYFTAGLGGSGEVNLYITNEGFGEPVPVYRNGEYAPQMESGANTRKVEFFLEEGEPSQKLVGERDVWSMALPRRSACRQAARHHWIVVGWYGHGAGHLERCNGYYGRCDTEGMVELAIILERPCAVQPAARLRHGPVCGRDARDANRCHERDVRRKGLCSAGARILPAHRWDELCGVHARPPRVAWAAAGGGKRLRGRWLVAAFRGLYSGNALCGARGSQADARSVVESARHIECRPQASGLALFR